MKTIKGTYINGQFTEPIGHEIVNIISPLDEHVIATLQYANEYDTTAAIEAANNALKTYAKSSVAQRKTYLQKIHDELLKKVDELIEATIMEYGAPLERTCGTTSYPQRFFQALPMAL